MGLCAWAEQLDTEADQMASTLHSLEYQRAALLEQQRLR